jgi:hypothetical protein
MLTSPFRDQCIKMGIYGRRECGCRPIRTIPNEKARSQFPGAGSIVTMINIRG